MDIVGPNGSSSRAVIDRNDLIVVDPLQLTLPYTAVQNCMAQSVFKSLASFVLPRNTINVLKRLQVEGILRLEERLEGALFVSRESLCTGSCPILHIDAE